jgi:hypothetical protein
MKMYIGLHVKYPLFLSDFNGNLICRQIFEKYRNIKFHENLFSRSRVVPRGLAGGRTDRERDTDRQTVRRTEMTKLIVTLRNFANAPNKEYFIRISNCTEYFTFSVNATCQSATLPSQIPHWLYYYWIWFSVVRKWRPNIWENGTAHASNYLTYWPRMDSFSATYLAHALLSLLQQADCSCRRHDVTVATPITERLLSRKCLPLHSLSNNQQVIWSLLYVRSAAIRRPNWSRVWNVAICKLGFQLQTFSYPFLCLCVEFLTLQLLGTARYCGS